MIQIDEHHNTFFVFLPGIPIVFYSLAMSAQFVDRILEQLNGTNPCATFAELNVKTLHKLYVFEWLLLGFKVHIDRSNWKTRNEFCFLFANKFLRLAFLEDARIDGKY